MLVFQRPPVKLLHKTTGGLEPHSPTQIGLRIFYLIFYAVVTRKLYFLIVNLRTIE